MLLCHSWLVQVRQVFLYQLPPRKVWSWLLAGGLNITDLIVVSVQTEGFLLMIINIGSSYVWSCTWPASAVLNWSAQSLTAHAHFSELKFLWRHNYIVVYVLDEQCSIQFGCRSQYGWVLMLPGSISHGYWFGQPMWPPTQVGNRLYHISQHWNSMTFAWTSCFQPIILFKKRPQLHKRHTSTLINCVWTLNRW